MHDGGMLLMLAYLLRKDHVWANTSVRVFLIAQVAAAVSVSVYETDVCCVFQPKDDVKLLHRDLVRFMYNVRIDAQVHVVEMVGSNQPIKSFLSLLSV
jgi:potassium/chloride transporter 4/5/6